MKRTTEKVGIKFFKVDTLMNNVNKIYLKKPFRVQVFKQMLLDISLPQEPLLTRWGTCLNNTIFLIDY